MDDLIARFVGQMDGLVPFLALGHETIHIVVSVELTPWIELEEHPVIPDDLELHQEQVAHAAFLLGYSYFEALVTDLILTIYRQRPQFLPPRETLAYEVLLSADDLEDVLEKMIDHTTSSMNSLEKKLLHLENRFGIGKECPPLILDAHVARNALIHNSGRINRVPKGHTRWKLGDSISFNCEQAYKFILTLNRFGGHLVEAVEKLLAGVEHRPA